MTPTPLRTLAELEAVIGSGLKTFIEVGRALFEVCDRGLYKDEGFQTFADYCEQRWQMRHSHAYRLIDAAGVAKNISPRGDIPKNEKQARPLARLTEEAQREVASGINFDTATANDVCVAVDKHVAAQPAALRNRRRGRPPKHQADHKPKPAKKVKAKAQPKPAKEPKAASFIRRIAAELSRRRKEIGDKNATGRWLPNNVAKLELSHILDWIQDELEAFNRGQSVNGRENAKRTPQLTGHGESYGTQTEVGINAAD